MCLIIARRPGCEEISEASIREAARSNSDGFGIVGMDESGVYIHKTMDMKESVKLIRLAESRDMTFVAHMRIKTAGYVNLDNCHPYQIFGANYLAHNGVISIPTDTIGFSDTWHMTEVMKRDAVKAFKREQVTPQFIEKWFELYGTELGTNKFALLGEDIPLTIVGKERGITEKGVWYSNTSFRVWTQSPIDLSQWGGRRRAYTRGLSNPGPLGHATISFDERADNTQRRRQEKKFTKSDADTDTYSALNLIDREHQYITVELESGDADVAGLEAIRVENRGAWLTLWKYYEPEMFDIYADFAEEQAAARELFGITPDGDGEEEEFAPTQDELDDILDMQNFNGEDFV